MTYPTRPLPIRRLPAEATPRTALVWSALVWAALVWTPLGGAAAQATAQEAPEFKQVFATYRQYLQRPSLYKRMLGRTKLAATADPRAMHELIAGYGRAEAPRDHVQYMIASMVMRRFRGQVDAATRAEWRDDHKKSPHAWLWYESTRHWVLEDSAKNAALDDVRGRGDVFVRAARLLGVLDVHDAVADDPALATTCYDLLAKLPRKDVEKAVVLETVAACLVAAREKVRDEPWRGVAASVIDSLDDPKLPHRTKVAVSRALTRAFDTTNLGFDPRWWRSELERDPSQHRESSAGKTVSFMSVQTFGTRFVYLIDASDSMLRKISPLATGPITGPRGQKGGDRPEDQLDWTRIVTRFDAAREYLRISIEALEPEHEFAVVLFGDEAATLASTPRLMEANPKNIAAAVAELAAIQAGPPTGIRPDGVLRGQTNLHGGFLAAYQLTDKGMGTRGPEYVDANAMLRGADTIFVLSDGAPTWCNWVAADARDPEDQAGDPETGVKFDNVPTLIFMSPYGAPPFNALVEDVERLNLFRRAEVHCIGLGEADGKLLDEIARVTRGTATVIKER